MIKQSLLKWVTADVGNAAETSPENHAFVPSPRAGHSLVFNPHSNSFLLFGGASHEEGHTNSLFSLPSLKGDWVQIPNAIHSPSPRYEHAVIPIVSENKFEMIVMYGAGPADLLDDIWLFSTGTFSLISDTQEWSLFQTTGAAPSPRINPYVAYLGENETVGARIYLFGGAGANNIPVEDSHIHCLDIDCMLWNTLQIEGPRPMSRMGHSFSVVKNKIYMFGGTTLDAITNEFWIFDTDINKWEKVENDCIYPSPRCGHNSVVLGESILIFGGINHFDVNPLQSGVFVLDTNEKIFKSIQVEGNSNRIDSACCVAGELRNNVLEHVKVIMFGGMDLKCMFNDLQILDISNEL